MARVSEGSVYRVGSRGYNASSASTCIKVRLHLEVFCENQSCHHV
jgi:hypothetical protein